jgi:hypothetical protein
MMERILNIVKTLSFIGENPNCSVPYIRDQFGITHADPPSKEEKNLYKTINLLDTQGYIKKTYFKIRVIGGARFSLSLTKIGQEYINQIGRSKASKEEFIEKMEVSIRLIIREKIKDRVVKSVRGEFIRELSDAIMEEISLNY